MAQADCLFNANRAPNTGAGTNPTSDPIRAAYAEFVTAVAGHPPRPIPISPHPLDLEDRADHLRQVLTALSVYLPAILEDTAQNVPGGLELGAVEALLCDLVSEVVGTLGNAFAAVSSGRAA